MNKPKIGDGVGTRSPELRLGDLSLATTSSDGVPQQITELERATHAGGEVTETSLAVPVEVALSHQNPGLSSECEGQNQRRELAVPSGGEAFDSVASSHSGDQGLDSGVKKQKNKKQRRKGHGVSGSFARRASQVEGPPQVGLQGDNPPGDPSRKRSRPLPETPDSLNRQKTKAPRQEEGGAPPLYSATVSRSLQMAIIFDGQPTRALTSEEVEAVQSGVMEKILDAPDPIQFESSGLTQKGVFRVTCHDDVTKKWLVETIPAVHALEGLSLRALPFDELQRMYRVAVRVPKMSVDTERLKVYLAKQNPGLDTSSWVPLHRVAVDPNTPNKGEIHFYTADAPSLEVLETRYQFRPFFQMCRIATWSLSRTSQGGAESSA
ncbi:MAG: DUF4780 domain-containing protein [Gammaproteobacteria bacterium]|nr:DUF4780 domain-containing protein [Gammaproteobacteria bacterium]